MADSKPRSIFVWIILGLLFVGLMGFGATGLSGNVRTVGNVGDKPLTAQGYYQELRGQMRLAESQIGRPLSFPEAQSAGLPQRALQSLVATRVLDNEVTQMGLSVGDDVVREQVLGNPAFRGLDGAFDQATYRDLLQRNGTDISTYETSLREDAARGLLQAAVYTGLTDPALIGTTLAGFTRETRDFTWATLTAEQIDAELPTPEEADLTAYYDENPAAFTTPETRELRYAWISPDMIQDDMQVDETALRAEYDARIDSYQQPERRLVERLVFPNDDDATAAMAAITAGETDFPTVVADRGLSLNDIDLGDLTEAQLGTTGAAVFATQPGDVVGPFATDLGPALFRMNAILAARNTSFEEALPDLREDLSAARARRFIEDQIDPIENLLAGGAGIADLAEQTAMELGDITVTADTSTGIAAYDDFRTAAQSAAPGDFPELVELDDGGLFALEVVSVTPPALIPFADVEDEVIAGWEAQTRAAQVQAAAEDMAHQLAEDPALGFDSLGLDGLQDTRITRRDFINGTPPAFVTEVFEMEPGTAKALPYEGHALIVRLDQINAADPSDGTFTTEATSLSEAAGESIAQDVYELYSRAVQMRTDITIDDAAISAVHGSMR